VTTSRPLVAVIPFGAKGRDAKAGGIGRQVARRLVERFADDPNLELRPVFLVAIPETRSDEGYFVFGSTPAPDLAARYGESLGTTHALTGAYREDEKGRAFAVTLVDVKARRVAAERALVVAPDELHLAEPALAAWLAEVLRVPPPGVEPETANEPSYRGLLAGLENETDATLLRTGDPSAADAARARAFDEYVAAVKLDPESVRAEERPPAPPVKPDVAPLRVEAKRKQERAPSTWELRVSALQLGAGSGGSPGCEVTREHDWLPSQLVWNVFVQLPVLVALQLAP